MIPYVILKISHTRAHTETILKIGPDLCYSFKKYRCTDYLQNATCFSFFIKKITGVIEGLKIFSSVVLT